MGWIVQKEQLEIYGYSVTVVNDGQKAVKTALSAESTFDIILMDIDLGDGIDGTEAAELILKEKDIPVVFCGVNAEP